MEDTCLSPQKMKIRTCSLLKWDTSPKLFVFCNDVCNVPTYLRRSGGIGQGHNESTH